MADTPVKKSILRATRDAIQWVLHMILVPLVAILKGASTMFTHAADDAALAAQVTALATVVGTEPAPTSAPDAPPAA